MYTVFPRVGIIIFLILVKSRVEEVYRKRVLDTCFLVAMTQIRWEIKCSGSDGACAANASRDWISQEVPAMNIRFSCLITAYWNSIYVVRGSYSKKIRYHMIPHVRVLKLDRRHKIGSRTKKIRYHKDAQCTCIETQLKLSTIYIQVLAQRIRANLRHTMFSCCSSINF